jgi:hypothetical protein
MSGRKKYIIITVIILTTGVSPAASVEFFSSDKISRNPHGALLRSPSISALYLYSTDKNKHFTEFDFGAKIPGISLRNENNIDVDIGGAGGVFTRFELFSESFNFVHADFTGSIFADIRYRRFSFETSVYHTSSHIGDDYIKYRHASVKNTGFEAIKHHTTFLTEYLDISLGFEYKFSRRPIKTLFANPSIFFGSRLNLLPDGIPLFIECEIEIIAGKYLPNIGVRAGIYLKYIFNTIVLGRPASKNEPHELSIYYYNGYSKMGYFYNRRESLVLFGPTYRY